MSTLLVSLACSYEKHEVCPREWGHRPGLLGGYICICECHKPPTPPSDESVGEKT